MDTNRAYSPEELAELRRQTRELKELMDKFQTEVVPQIMALMPTVNQMISAMRAAGLPVNSLQPEEEGR